MTRIIMDNLAQDAQSSNESDTSSFSYCSLDEKPPVGMIGQQNFVTDEFLEDLSFSTSAPLNPGNACQLADSYNGDCVGVYDFVSEINELIEAPKSSAATPPKSSNGRTQATYVF